MTVKPIKDWEGQLDMMSKSTFGYLKNRQLNTLGREPINDISNLFEYFNNNNIIIKRCLNE